MLRRNAVRNVEFLGDHARKPAAGLVGAQEDLVGHDVELLLLFALDVDCPRAAEDTRECPRRDAAGDRLAPHRDVEDERAELSAQTRVTSTFLDEELGQRRALGQHCFEQTSDIDAGHPPEG
jgi:hypothetical protein